MCVKMLDQLGVCVCVLDMKYHEDAMVDRFRIQGLGLGFTDRFRIQGLGLGFTDEIPRG